MSIIRKIKNLLFVRNCGVLLHNIKRFFMSRRAFGNCDSSVIITPPTTSVILATFTSGHTLASAHMLSYLP